MYDPLSKNPASLHILDLHFLISLLLRGKNQWAITVSALSGEYFWSYNGRSEKSKIIDLYSDYMENKVQALVNRS